MPMLPDQLSEQKPSDSIMMAELEDSDVGIIQEPLAAVAIKKKGKLKIKVKQDFDQSKYKDMKMISNKEPQRTEPQVMISQEEPPKPIQPAGFSEPQST